MLVEGSGPRHGVARMSGPEADLSVAHEVNHELNQLLRLIATDDYLHTALEYELKKKNDPEPQGL